MARYADLGPPVPLEAPDQVPFRCDHIEELAQRNALGEVVFLVTGRDSSGLPMKLILATSPRSGAITRAAVWMRPGAGYVACHTDCVPGNLRDVVATIALEAGAADDAQRAQGDV